MTRATSKKLAQSLLCFVLFFGLGEGYARLVAPDDLSHKALPGDQVMGWRLQPNTRIWDEAHSITINSHGFRGPETSLEKPAGTFRIVLLGDSSVFGHGVGDAQTLSSQLQRRLREEVVQPPVEVLNFGTAGYSTVQSILLMEQGGFDFEPDLVVVASLWSDCVRANLQDEDLFGQLSHQRGGWSKKVEDWLGMSRFYNIFRNLLRRPLTHREYEFADLSALSGAAGPDQGERPSRVPLDDYEGNLRELYRLASIRGAETTFVLLPHPRDLEAGTDGACPDYRQVMGRVAVDTQSPLVDGPSLFRTAGGAPSSLFMDDLHPNGEGHRRLAGELAETILEDDGISGTFVRTALDP